MAKPLIKESLETGVRFIEVRAAKQYLKGIKSARQIFLATLYSQMFLILAGLSLILALLGLIYLLPIALATKILLISIFLLGTTTFCLFFFLKMNSEERWLRNSHADEILLKVLRDRNKY